jgi:hypothetical protein
MADATAGDFHHDLVGAWLQGREVMSLQGLTRRNQAVTVGAADNRHGDFSFSSTL